MRRGLTVASVTSDMLMTSLVEIATGCNIRHGIQARTSTRGLDGWPLAVKLYVGLGLQAESSPHPDNYYDHCVVSVEGIPLGFGS